MSVCNMSVAPVYCYCKSSCMLYNPNVFDVFTETFPELPLGCILSGVFADKLCLNNIGQGYYESEFRPVKAMNPRLQEDRKKNISC